MFKKFKNYLLLFSSMMTKKNKCIWIFGSWFGEKFADNSKYLFIKANKLSSIRPIWITKNENVLKSLRELGYEVYMYDSNEGIYLQKRAKYVFVTISVEDCNPYALGNATIINLWHGVPLKKVLYDDQKFEKHGLSYIIDKIYNIPFKNTFVISTSEEMQKIYSSSFKQKIHKILILGQPRNDIFYEESGDELKEIFYGRKIILYMPTHRNEGKKSLNCNVLFDLDSIEKLCEENDYVFLIKKHFFHSKEYEKLESYSYIFDITNTLYDTQELLKSANILITDYSSCYIDYLLLNRPIVFYNFDFDDYLMNDREMYFEYDSVTPGIKVTNYEDLFSSLYDIIVKNIDNYVDDRKNICDLFYSSNCQSIVGEKIIDVVLKM